MFWAAIVVLYLTMIRMIVALTNLVTRPFPGWRMVTRGPLVSVLIPARNEEKNIGKLLESLTNQTYENFEVIVYNDSSTDGTASVIERFTHPGGRVRHIDGTELPGGWLGKNHACHNLAQQAAGEYLLFIDADVTTGKDLLSTSVARMQEQGLELLSIFPYQLMMTRGERVVVPVMNWILLSLLPLALVRYCRWSSFSAANGQFMMFRTSVYKRYWFHSMVRGKLTEDIVIARLMKRMKLRIQTLVSRGEVSCRMYNGYDEAVNGFAKNVITMFGDSIPFIVFFAMVSLAGWLVVLTGLGWWGLVAYILMVGTINVSVAATGGQRIADSVLLFPERMAAFIIIVIRSLRVRIGNSYTWKDREISNIQ